VLFLIIHPTLPYFTRCTILRQYNTLTHNLELTPAEEAALRAKEAAEQAALPYKWTQTIGDLDITVEIPGNLKGKDLNVDIKKKKLLLGIKGQDPIITVRPHPSRFPLPSAKC
jgi:HSP20 family molecular chaperone IbpA